MKQIIQQITNKKVVFITTKNLDYIRNTQEMNLLKEHAAEVVIIGSAKRSYLKRLMYVYAKLLSGSFRKFDVVFVGFAPQLVLPFFGWKFKSNIVIEDFFISLYDTFVDDRKKLKPDSLAARYMKHLDRKALEKADHVISDTNAHGAYFVQEFGCPSEKIHTIYLEADKKIYYPRKASGKHDKFRVLYFGSILPVQGVDVVLKAGELLKDTSIEMEIIGPVPEADKVDAAHMIYHEWLEQTELAEHIAEADLCLAGHFNPDIGKALRTIPGKAYIYEAMKRPMILGDSPANHELFSEDQDGIYFVEMGNPYALAELIRKIAAYERHNYG